MFRAHFRDTVERRLERGDVYQIGQVGAAKTGSPSSDDVEIDVSLHLDVFGVGLQNLASSTDVRIRHGHGSIETTRTDERLVEHPRRVRRREYDDAFARLEPIHFGQQLIQRHPRVLLILRVPRRADGVDFVDEDDTRRVLFRRFEQISHASRADADEHFLKFAPARVEEGYPSFPGDSLR